MNDVEDRLIGIIDIRRAGRHLGPRERRIVARYFRDEETFREIGLREGRSPERIRQVINGSLRKLRYRLRDRPTATPATPRPPPGFDPASFLNHMLLLNRMREGREARVLSEARAELEGLIGREGKQAAVLPQAKTLYIPKLKPPPLYEHPQPKYEPKYHYQVHPGVQAVEPWFDPATAVITAEHMGEIARYAVGYFVAVWRGASTTQLGVEGVQLVCRRDADSIAGQLGMFARGLPAGARVSGVSPYGKPSDAAHAVESAGGVALGATSGFGGAVVAIDLTWTP